MAGDPADIRRAPIDVALTQIENVFRGRVDSDQIPAACVQDAFRFPGRTTGIENVKRVFAVERGRRAFGVDIFELAMPPDVASFFDVNLIPGAAKNDHPTDRSSATKCIVNVLLQRDNCTASISAIGRDHCGRAAVRDAITNAVGTKAAEDN